MTYLSETRKKSVFTFYVKSSSTENENAMDNGPFLIPSAYS